MFASTYVFTASPLSPGVPSPVVRVKARPATEIVVEARSVVGPGVFELSVIEHSPVVPTVLQLVALRSAGPLTFVKPTTVSAGAFADPEPSLTLTCAVKVCGEPTSFVAAFG